jgi:uncharacterized protein with HEPN domain
MLDAAKKSVQFASGRTRFDLNIDEMFSLSTVRLLEIIGEAAKSVSASFRNEHPEIPWQAIAGTRDRLIHGYFDVDLDIVWEIINIDLPLLITKLESFDLGRENI